MTEWQLNNFDEDQMHVWIPQFTVNESEEDKLWLTLIYSIALNGGWDNRYEFYVTDFKSISVDHITDLHNYIAYWNMKYGEWVKIGYIDGHHAFFIIQRKDWDFVEYYVKPGLWQRKWIHALAQLFDHNGFRHDVFQKDDQMWQWLDRRKAFSSVTQEGAWWMSNKENWVVGKRLKPTHNYPMYLNPPAIKKGKHVPTYKGCTRVEMPATLTQRKDEN